MGRFLVGRLLDEFKLENCKTDDFFVGWYCNGMTCYSPYDCASGYCNDNNRCSLEPPPSAKSSSSTEDDGLDETTIFAIVGFSILAVLVLIGVFICYCCKEDKGKSESN